MDLQNWIDKGYDLIINFAPKVIGAILIWVIGSWVIKLIIKGIKKALEKGDYDISLKKFLINLATWAFKILLIVIVLGTVGVETTSFAAILAAAGLAVGLALQGSLANFAGGVLIMLFKPFKVGDLIECQGEVGTVKLIEIFTTKLTGLSNKEIIIPNGVLSNGNIVNYSTEGTRRVDLIFGVGYDSDIKKTKEELNNYIKKNNSIRLLKAYKNHKFFVADGNQFFNRPGPRLVESLEIFAEIIHPDIFNFKHKEGGWINYND